MKLYLNKTLLRSDQHKLFKWSSKGIFLDFNYSTINLDILPLYDALDLLENLLDNELTINQRMDVLEVKEYFRDKL